MLIDKLCLALNKLKWQHLRTCFYSGFQTRTVDWTALGMARTRGRTMNDQLTAECAAVALAVAKAKSIDSDGSLSSVSQISTQNNKTTNPT